MVHNGIEYGLMHAYAEGYELLAGGRARHRRARRAALLARRHRRALLAARPAVAALDEDPELASIRGYAEDTGEGRWTVEEAIRLAVPLNVITASLYARFASRQDDSPAMKAVAALRNQFGGHAVKS